MSILTYGYRLAKSFLNTKRFSKCFKNASKTLPIPDVKPAATVVTNSASSNIHSKTAKPLFCEEYWAFAKKNGLVRNRNASSVDLHGELHSINHHFHISPYPKHMDLPDVNVKLTPREMITKTDLEFKALKPTEKSVTAFRAVGEKPEFFQTYKLYEKAAQVKPGDKILMNEYSYFTSDINYADVYLTNKRGILYEIEFPKDSRISRIGDFGLKDEIVTPRASEFLCTSVNRIKSANSDYLHVKGRYIQPKNIFE